MCSRMKYVRVDDSLYDALMRARNVHRVRSIHAVVKMLVQRALPAIPCQQAPGEMIVKWLCVGKDVHEALVRYKEHFGASSMRATVRHLLESA